MHLPDYPVGLAFVPPFLEGRVAFVSDQDPAPSVRIRDSKRRLGGLVPGFRLAFCEMKRRWLRVMQMQPLE
jgi:hypothetical protein